MQAIKIVQLCVLSIMLNKTIEINASDYVKRKFNDVKNYIETSDSTVATNLRKTGSAINKEANKIDQSLGVSSKFNQVEKAAEQIGSALYKEAEQFEHAINQDVIALENFLKNNVLPKETPTNLQKNKLKQDALLSATLNELILGIAGQTNMDNLLTDSASTNDVQNLAVNAASNKAVKILKNKKEY
ncbi:MAG: hypothetical protein ACXWL5_03825 [Candidatus Chromulinivorax sp.]